MKQKSSMLALGLLTAVIGPLASAQTTTPASTDHPTPIATSQQAADQANRKAHAARGHRNRRAYRSVRC